MTDTHDTRPAGSAYLHTEPRSRHEYALEVAVNALKLIRAFEDKTLMSVTNHNDYSVGAHNAFIQCADTAGDALDRIAAIMPEAAK